VPALPCAVEHIHRVQRVRRGHCEQGPGTRKCTRPARLG
jgi:hypothetical protein